MRPIGTGTKSQPQRGGRIAEVLGQIAGAAGLAADAENAYRRADERAGRLHAAAECAHRDLLRSICELSEAEADSIEPAFTEFESRLLHLPAVSSQHFLA